MSAKNGHGSSSSQGGAASLQQQQSSSTTGTKSKELCYHNLDCPYYVLSRQKSNLLTDNELHSEMVAHYLRKWNTTLESSGGSVVARAMAYSNQALETGVVRDYLSSQRSYFDDKIERELEKCQCVAARISPSNGDAEGTVKMELEDEDLDGAANSPPILVKEEPIQIEVQLGQNGIGAEDKVVVD